MNLPYDIADCETDEQRALWLLRCPLAHLLRDEVHIRRWLRLTQFKGGLDYLETEISHLREDRRDDGYPMHSVGIATARGRASRLTGDLAEPNAGA